MVNIKHKLRRTAALALCCVLLASLLTGCSEKLELLRGQEEKYEIEKSSDVYLAMGYVRTLNPALSKDEDVYYISKLIYDGLFELDETMAAVPKLVKSYSYSEDSTELDITLRDDVYWHDGEKLTADDVKYTVELLQSLGSDTLYSNYVSNIKSVKVNKSDKQQLTITFKSGADSAEAKLIFPIMPEHQYKSVADMKKHTDDFTPIGTGPYKVDEYDLLTSLKLSPNESYYDAVSANTLTFEVVPGSKEALSLLNVDEISLVFIKDIDRETIINNTDAVTQNFPSNCVEVIGFNQNKEYLKNKKLRQAIAYATDSKKILESAYYSCGILTDSLYYPGYLGVENEGDSYEYNLEKAAELLKKAGMKDSDGDGYLEYTEGEALSIEILIKADDVSQVAAAQLIKKSLGDIQVAAEIAECSEEDYRSRLAAGSYDIFIGEYTFADYYDLRSVLHSGYGNVINYSNENVDSKLELLAKGATKDKAKVYKELKKTLKEDLPYYPILCRTYGMVMSNSLVGESTPLFNDFYRDAANWTLEYKRAVTDEKEETTDESTDETADEKETE